MQLKNYYWYFESAVPTRICDHIVKLGKASHSKTATIGNTKQRDLKNNPFTKKEIKNLQKKRDSDIVWFTEKWIYNEITPYIHAANKNAGWNFEWSALEATQFTKYKKGQHYGWHCDSWSEPYKNANPLQNGKIRKLSMTLLLSSKRSFKGGDLEFDFRDIDPDKVSMKKSRRTCTEIGNKGSLVVFPSFLWHRVKPVMKGTRHSLVVWCMGAPFK